MRSIEPTKRVLHVVAWFFFGLTSMSLSGPETSDETNTNPNPDASDPLYYIFNIATIPIASGTVSA